MNEYKEYPLSWGFRKRPPDLIIYRKDEHYIHRWYLIPYNRYFNVYLHKVLLDDDQSPHDHPWWNFSLLLKGGYWETKYIPVRWGRIEGKERYGYNTVCNYRSRGSMVFRRATTIHRLDVENTYLRYAWSLFITGPTKRDWGFWGRYGFVSHKVLLDIDRVRGTSKFKEHLRHML